jgi:hypothetical protein
MAWRWHLGRHGFSCRSRKPTRVKTTCLTVNFPTMAKFNNKDYQLVILNFANHSTITYSVTPQTGHVSG